MCNDDRIHQPRPRKDTRGLTRLTESAAVQAGIAKREAQLGRARAYLLQTLDDIAARAPADRAIAVPDRAKLRLAATNAIHEAIEVADWLYKNAGVDAIYCGSAFERRFRDMHTLSQQIQSREAHYEAIGQVLLNNPPAVFY